jgi:hypothetical protein
MRKVFSDLYIIIYHPYLEGGKKRLNISQEKNIEKKVQFFSCNVASCPLLPTLIHHNPFGPHNSKTTTRKESNLNCSRRIGFSPSVTRGLHTETSLAGLDSNA